MLADVSKSSVDRADRPCCMAEIIRLYTRRCEGETTVTLLSGDRQRGDYQTEPNIISHILEHV